MNLKKVHYFSGIIITIFVFFHLINHFYGLSGAQAHIDLMTDFRLVYRNLFAETILLIAVCFQIISGIKLVTKIKKTASSFFEKLQIWSGLYLAFFLVIHVSAVLGGRILLDLDTNFYFGVAGLNSFPFNLFFIPYYSLAILAFFGHFAAIHAQKFKKTLLGISPTNQSYAILIIGVLITFILLYGLTNGFKGIEIPEAYQLMIGK